MFACRIETTINQEGILCLEALPFEPGDKVEIIILKQDSVALQPKQRTVGEYAGKIRMADDFDAPLPDSFWLGESS
ncbi:MAG: hypothetical protein GY862_29790 [Gammaproteobacteria bacterium]|nr:hypothetical protein [Gammaproteobacteria bacterium]